MPRYLFGARLHQERPTSCLVRGHALPRERQRLAVSIGRLIESGKPMPQGRQLYKVKIIKISSLPPILRDVQEQFLLLMTKKENHHGYARRKFIGFDGQSSQCGQRLATTPAGTEKPVCHAQCRRFGWGSKSLCLVCSEQQHQERQPHGTAR